MINTSQVNILPSVYTEIEKGLPACIEEIKIIKGKKHPHISLLVIDREDIPRLERILAQYEKQREYNRALKSRATEGKTNDTHQRGRSRVPPLQFCRLDINIS